MINPFEKLKKIVKHAEKDWEKSINNEKNPILKQIRKDFKDLNDLQCKLMYFEKMYGICLELKYPKKINNKWLFKI